MGIGGALPGASTRRIDDFGLAEASANHLIRLGHSKTAHMTGDAAYDHDFKLPAPARAVSKKR